MNKKLFVYGTLMSSCSNPESKWKRQENILLGRAYIKGLLYDINGYPGAIYDPTANGIIVGELYRLHQVAKTLRWLDEYEEASPEYHPDPEYKRIMVPVFYHEKKIQAWMYQYILPTEGLTRIQSGSYLDFIKIIG